MRNKWRVNRVDEDWKYYVPELSEFIGRVLEEVETDYSDNSIQLKCDDSDWWFKREWLTQITEATPVTGNRKYDREIKPNVFVDVYDVLYAFKVTDPCLQHLIKKALAAGQRGHKDARQDLVDIRDSAQRALDSYDLWEVKK